ARELDQAFHIAFEQRSDDVAHIATRAEISLVRAEDDRLDVIGGRQLAERVAQFVIGIERYRVLALAALERNQRHVAFGAPVEMHWLEIFHIHGRASPLRTLLTSPSSC